MVDEGGVDRRLEQLGGERLPVDDESVAVLARAPQQIARRAHSRLCGRLRAADPLQLVSALDAPPVLEEVAVGRHLDPVRAEMVGEPERERRRDDGVRDPQLLHGPQQDLLADLPEREPRPDEVIEPELLRRVQLVQAERGQPGDLHRADLDVPGAVLLDVQERVRNPDRHLVPHLRRAERVGVDQHVGHERDSN